MSTVMTDKELASELFDTVCALEAENADLRSGEYLARVIEERDRYRKALEDVKDLNVPESGILWSSYAFITLLERVQQRASDALKESTNESA